MILLQQVKNAEQNASVTLYQYTDLVTLVIWTRLLQYTTPVALPTISLDSWTYNKSIGYCNKSGIESVKTLNKLHIHNLQ